ncbi:hypothetical protein GVN24_30280 [Rhizobium sp. CRIBSB]|nr:hypothetical protein [Rhizobium sp. CRIBSB]
MLDPSTDSLPDLRPSLVICAYDNNEVCWDPVEDLSGRAWSPPGARTVAASADTPDALAETLIEHLRDASCRGVLLVGRTRESGSFRIQTRAENRMPGKPHRIDPNAPGLARTTVPVADIVRALNDAGLLAVATSEAEDDSGDYLLFRVLNAMSEGTDTPAVGLLRAPVDLTDEVVAAGIKAAAAAIAAHMSPLPRRRPI